MQAACFIRATLRHKNEGTCPDTVFPVSWKDETIINLMYTALFKTVKFLVMVEVGLTHFRPAVRQIN